MKKIALALISAGLLLGCSAPDDNCGDGLTPIMLTSKITVVERGSLQDIQLASGQKVGFFVTSTGDYTNLVYDNVLLTASGTGFFSYGNGIMYYPVNPARVDFYAMHPYSKEASVGTPVSFMIKSDQSIRENYYDSDLLYARQYDIIRNPNAVPLIFAHKLSKLTFVVKAGAGGDLTSLKDIQILDVLSSGHLYLETGNVLTQPQPRTDVAVFGVKGTSGSEVEVSGMAAIIVPQDFIADGSKQLFRVGINGVDYYYVPPANLLFEEGKVYNFTLTVSSSGIEVTSSIENWYPGGDIEGEVT